MAPIATSAELQSTIAYAQKGTADYKEAGGGLKDYNSKLEEEGEEKAHVGNLVFVLRNIGSAFVSIRTTFPRGILMKSILP